MERRFCRGRYPAVALRRANLMRQLGFTLLEIMVAVMLVAVASSFVVLNLGDNQGKQTLHEAEKFAALVNHALDESILLGKPIGIEVDEGENVYRFQIFDGGWQMPEKDHFLRPRQIPEGFRIRFDLMESNRQVRADNQQKSKYTPSRVHEILNDSILDDGDSADALEALFSNANMIVAEPTGLLPPFSFEVSDEGGRSFSVVLNDFGKAIVELPDERR